MLRSTRNFYPGVDAIEQSMSTDRTILLIVISMLPSKCMSGVVMVTEMKTIHVSPKD